MIEVLVDKLDGQMILSLLLVASLALILTQAFTTSKDDINTVVGRLVWPIAAVLLVLVLAIVPNVIGPPSQIGDRAGNSTSDLIGLSVGLIGLVITALTGMALASAWRAKDQAALATEQANKIIDQFVEKERELYRNFAMQQAYVEALDLKIRYPGGDPLLRIHSSLANLLVRAFSTRNEREMFEMLIKIANDDLLRQEFGSIARDGRGIPSYLNDLLSFGSGSHAQNAAIHKLLS